MIAKCAKNEILERLGPIPFWRGEKKSTTMLEAIYTRASERAKRIIDKLDKSK